MFAEIRYAYYFKHTIKEHTATTKDVLREKIMYFKLIR